MEKDKFEDFFNYYLSDEFINNLELPERIGFTHFRGRTSKGGWRKIPVKISSKEELQKWIIKLGLVDLYYSTSEWLNPHKVSAKVGSGNYLCADNLILKNNLVFDIDCEKPVTIKGLDNARIACKEIHESISRMKKKGKDIENKYFAFSGSRGFRLVYDDKSYVMPSNYRDRLEKTEQNRKLFILELLKDIKGKTSEKRFKMIRGVIDQNITTNPLCIIRIIGSAHSKTRFISTKLPLGLLYKKVDTFINNIPYIGKIKPGILRNKEMTLEEENNLVIPPSPRSDILVDDVAGLASLPRNYFLTNRVLGVRKCFIPVLVYGKGYKKEVKILQKKYRLGKLFVF